MRTDPTPTELLAELLRSTPDGLLLVDTDGIIQYANPAADTLFQRAHGALVGQHFGVPDAAGIRDIELVRDDGSLRTVEMRPVETTWQGEPVWVIALRDATEQRHREQQLQTQLQAGSEHTGEVIHELGTTLGVIIGFADTLDRNWDKMTEDQRRDFSRRIGVHGRRAQRMFQRLRADTDDPRPHLEAVELWQVALSHLPDLGVRSVEIDCPRDIRVQADPTYLDEIVVNLVENAGKYGAPPITVSAHQSGDVVVLIVSDHGPGVPAAFVPRLFDRYSRADDARGSGSGLGLHLVDKFARACGGTVRYEPNDPTGSRFIVTLPAA